MLEHGAHDAGVALLQAGYRCGRELAMHEGSRGEFCLPGRLPSCLPRCLQRQESQHRFLPHTRCVTALARP